MVEEDDGDYEYYIDDDVADGNYTEELNLEGPNDTVKTGPAYLPSEKINHDGNTVYFFQKQKKLSDNKKDCINDYIRTVGLFNFSDNPNTKEYLYTLYTELSRMNPKKFPVSNINKFETDDGRWISDEEREMLRIPKYISGIPLSKTEVPLNFANVVGLISPPIGMEVYYALDDKHPIELIINDEFDNDLLNDQVIPFVLVKYYFIYNGNIYPLYRLTIDALVKHVESQIVKSDEHQREIFESWGIDYDGFGDKDIIRFLFPVKCNAVLDYVDNDTYKEITNATGNTSKRKHRRAFEIKN